MKVPGPEQQSAEPLLNGPGHQISTVPIGALNSLLVPGPDERQNLPNPALVMVPPLVYCHSGRDRACARRSDRVGIRCPTYPAFGGR